MSLTQIEGRPRARRDRYAPFAILCLLLLCLSALLRASSASPSTPELEVLPKHFMLHPGEQIHYNVLERPRAGMKPDQPCKTLVGFGCPDIKFATEDPTIVRLV